MLRMWLAADVQLGLKERLRLKPGADIEHDVDLLDTLGEDAIQRLWFEPPNAHVLITSMLSDAYKQYSLCVSSYGD